MGNTTVAVSVQRPASYLPPIIVVEAQALVDAMIKAGIHVQGAAWTRGEEPDDGYRLVIATALCPNDEVEALAATTRLTEVMKAAGIRMLTLDMVTLRAERAL